MHYTFLFLWHSAWSIPSAIQALLFHTDGDIPMQAHIRLLFLYLQTGVHSKYSDGLGSKPELSDLMNEIAAKIPGKWRDVGLQLGLDQGVLDGIALTNQGDTNHCYSNVFTRWKNQDSTTHPYTWSTVVQALESQTVGENQLASKIKNELTGHPHQ